MEWGNGARALGVMALALSVAAAPADVAGTYRLSGRAEVPTPAPVDRNVEVHADAMLRPVGALGELVVTLGAEGGRCDLRARLDGAGALQFPPDQRCVVELDSKDARGHLVGVLQAGSGHVDGDVLALDLSMQVDGAVRTRSPDRVDVLGKSMELPSGWMPEVPVHGLAHATAQGRRDRSRAAAGP